MITISVIKSKRSLASTQFLANLQKLENEVLAWCKTQGAKNAPYGLTDLFEASNNAFACAFAANKIYINASLDQETLQENINTRKELFDKSIKWCHAFNTKLTVLMSCYKISNTKIKRWMSYVYSAINQMNSVKKSDAKKLTKK